MITGNEPYVPVTTETMGIGGLTIRQELSVRFMAASISSTQMNGYVTEIAATEYAKESLRFADALIAEWNSESQK